MNTPVFRPVYKFSRTVEGWCDVITNGIVANLSAFDFRLNSLPNYTDFTNLFDMYRITKVEVEWLPEYTELTDASALSNSVNVRFNSAVDIADGSAPTSVSEVLEYGNVKSSGITKSHRSVFTPTFLMGGLVPCQCWLPTSNPS